MAPREKRTLYERGGRPQLDSEERTQVSSFAASLGSTRSRLVQPEAPGPSLQENEMNKVPKELQHLG